MAAELLAGIGHAFKGSADGWGSLRTTGLYDQRMRPVLRCIAVLWNPNRIKRQGGNAVATPGAAVGAFAHRIENRVFVTQDPLWHAVLIVFPEVVAFVVKLVHLAAILHVPIALIGNFDGLCDCPRPNELDSVGSKTMERDLLLQR